MHRKIKMLLVPICFLSFPLQSYADIYSDNEFEYKQKLILVQGKKSRLMDGDSRPNFNFNKKKVLPYYLVRGWKIQYVYINETSVSNNPSGYVVIEKRVPINKRFSHRH